MTAPLLEMRGISKAYGAVQANRGIDLRVPRGWILGLLGENGSGKSTLMKCLFGMVRPDAGTIEFKGRELAVQSPRDALAAGIGMIHQHFMLVDAMTVTENVMLGWDEAGRWLRPQAIATRIREASAAFGIEVEPDARVGDLPLGARQRVEILKAIVRGAELLVLDEPTSILSPPEVDALLAVLRKLRAQGRSVIFISHKLGEVLDLCDEVVVLRAGAVTAQRPVANATRAELAQAMVGRDTTAPLQRTERAPGPDVLTVAGLSARDAAGVLRLKDASFSLREGEILAIAGVDGNGQTELAHALAGLVRAEAGSVRLAGADIVARSPQDRLARGLAYIPADRATTSLVQDMAIADNLAMRDFTRPPLARGILLDRSARSALAARRIADFDVRCPGPEAPVRTLSGGNQQKVVVAREIGREPRVLIAMQPTWGLDPSATRFVVEQVLAVRARGGAVLYISSELEEVLMLGDRIGVMFDGRIVGIVDRADADPERIGLMMAGAAEDAWPRAA